MSDEFDTTCPDCGAPDSACCTMARRDLEQLRADSLRLAPLWADYSNDVRIAGCVVRAHPCDIDRIADAEAERERFRAALTEIANEDYRGSRPHSAVVAWRALHPEK